jgi:acyl-CoA synthetase (AMP-forming)/AMP-acid ligase II
MSAPPGAATAAAPLNVGLLLAEAARRTPGQVALVEPIRRGAWRRTSYAELDERTRRIAGGLAHLGLARGDRVCVFLRPGLDWLATVYALFRLGAVPVMIDPGMGRRAVQACVARTRPRGFAGIPLAHALRLSSPRAFASVKIAVGAGAPHLWSGPSLERLAREGDPDVPPATTAEDDPAAILFTSGATGPPKGVEYTHGNFAAQVRSLRELYALRPGEVDLACFPLFALLAPAFGWTSVLPALDFSRPGRCDPRALMETILEHGVESAFGSPAIWRRIAPFCAQSGTKLGALARLSIAGAPVEPRLVEACAALLAPGGEVHTPYGATEALPVSSARGGEILGSFRRASEGGAGNCVGRAAPGIELALISISDEPFPHWDERLRRPDGELGEVCVRGAQVTRRYADDPRATELAKIDDGDGSFWHRMGDVGRLDEHGNLWLLGRKAHRLETERGLLMPVGVENVFGLHPAVEKCALVGTGTRGRQRPVLVVQPERGALPRAKRRQADLAREILRAGLWFPACGRVERVLWRRSLPVDVRHNAKIDRLALKRWAERELR